MKIRTRRAGRMFTLGALLVSALLTTALLYVTNRPRTRPAAVSVPQALPEQREVACLDRLLKSEIPKGADVDRLVAGCRERDLAPPLVR